MNNETFFRIKKFRQFKEEIRGSEEYLIVGIDILSYPRKEAMLYGTRYFKGL